MTKKMMMRSRVLVLLGALAMLVYASPSGSAAPKSDGEKFSALAYLPSGAGAGSTANVEIYIQGYTSDERASSLQALLYDSGPDAVLKAFGKMETLGRISRVGSVGTYDFKVVRSFPTPNGRHIVAVADRPIGFLESYYNTRSSNYRFGVLELDLTKDGDHEKGQGSLIYAAKVKVKKDGTIDVENFGIEPVRLLGVNEL